MLLDIIESSRSYMLANFDEVLALEDVQNLDLITLRTLLIDDALNVRSEVELYKAISLWKKKNQTRKSDFAELQNYCRLGVEVARTPVS